MGVLRAHRTRVLQEPPPPTPRFHHTPTSEPTRAPEHGLAVTGHAVTAQAQHAPGHRGHSLPAGSEARGARSRGASTCQNRLPATWGEPAPAKASFRSREREKRASREGKASWMEPGAGAGAIHKPGRGWERSWGSLWVSSRGHGEMPTAEWMVRGFWGSEQLCLLPNPSLHSCPLRPRPRGLCVAGSGLVALTWWPPAIPAEGEQASGKPRRHWGEGAAGPRGSIK